MSPPGSHVPIVSLQVLAQAFRPDLSRLRFEAVEWVQWSVLVLYSHALGTWYSGNFSGWQQFENLVC